MVDNILKKIDYLSFSRYQAIQNCPRYFYNTYIEGKRTIATERMCEGTAAHERTYAMLFENKAPQPLQPFFDNAKEVKLEYKVEGLCDNVKWIGYVDVILFNEDGCLTLIDLKLNHLPDSFLQLEIYAALLPAKYDICDKIRLVFYSIEQERFIMKTISKRSAILSLKEATSDFISILSFAEKTGFTRYISETNCVNCAFVYECLKESFLNPSRIQEAFINDDKHLINKLALSASLSEAFVDSFSKHIKNYMMKKGFTELEVGGLKFTLNSHVCIRNKKL